MTQQPPAAPAATTSLDHRTKVIAGVVIIGALMSILDATVVVVAIETLSKDLDVGLATIQWTISGYTLALASVIPISGWLSDRFGARRVWLAGIVIFTTGSVLCALAPSAGVLIAFRCLQGLGGGVLSPVGTTMIARAAGPARMGSVMALMGVPLALGPVLGPVVGGVLIQYAGWQWIFLINAPIGLTAFILGWRLLPRATGAAAARLDLVGLLLLSPGLAAFLYGVSSVRSASDLTSPTVLVSVGAAVVLIVAFVVRTLRVDDPLVDLGLFRDRTFSAAAITTFTLGAAVFGAQLLVPLYFQQVRGESVLTTGLLTIPQAAGMAAAIAVSGKLSDRIGAGWVVPVGVLLALGGLFSFTTLTSTTSYWVIGAFLVLMGLGLGSSMMPAMSAAYAALKDAAAVSRATTELQVVQRVGSSLGSALFAVILAQLILGATSSGGRPDPAGLAGAYAGTYWWGVGLGVLALVPALFLPRKNLGVRTWLDAHHHPLAGNGGSPKIIHRDQPQPELVDR